MSESRWPQLPVIGDVALPERDGALWTPLLDLSRRLPDEHVVIGGVMVYLHGLVAGKPPHRVTRDVDVLFNVLVGGVLPEAVGVLEGLGYRLDPASPADSAHRYLGPCGEQVDVLAPMLRNRRSKPSLVTTPPNRTIEVPAGQEALEHRVVLRAAHGDDAAEIVVPDTARALKLKAAAYAQHHRARPSEAWNSRHLTDLAFLCSVIDDPDAVRDALGTPPVGGHLALAAVLDPPSHSAWTALGEAAEDARLVWEVLREP
ncbi:hypothetical protein [Actinosynnema pretiosum]|uniref:Nucleotidyl transferase AbiEii/AbiGii toxin family protein n=1 Tax=Actinosynnema pretiosum TaxID=42197 RepID=A0A290ZDP4_9PSEU|nr:hypothetical protein [Actinosynnema pretiosum]ATE57128.1 hypothetical protein CNX65_30730 [Actinosynnema pretiosum]